MPHSASYAAPMTCFFGKRVHAACVFGSWDVTGAPGAAHLPWAPGTDSLVPHFRAQGQQKWVGPQPHSWLSRASEDISSHLRGRLLVPKTTRVCRGEGVESQTGVDMQTLR